MVRGSPRCQLGGLGAGWSSRLKEAHGVLDVELHMPDISPSTLPQPQQGVSDIVLWKPSSVCVPSLQASTQAGILAQVQATAAATPRTLSGALHANL